LAEAQWALTGLALALLVLLVLPSAQIKLGASQLNGLIGSYTSGGHYWQVSYTSQGTTSWRSSSSEQTSRAWPSGASGDGDHVGSVLDATTKGAVTPTLKWVPAASLDSTTDPPPSQVIVVESGSAAYGYYFGNHEGGGSGTLKDGLNDPPTGNPYYMFSRGNYASGTRYEVKDGSSGTITLPSFSLEATTPTDTTAKDIEFSVNLNVSASQISMGGYSTVDTAGWLLAQPRFFSGTACQVRGQVDSIIVSHAQLLINNTVIEEYDDAALTPLTADPKVVYSTGTSQGTVSLAPLFDATIYAEGYLLPVKLRVWSSQGTSIEASLTPPVHLPQLTPYVIWTPDYTAAPVNGQIPQALASSGAAMGYNSTLRVRVAYPPTVSGTLTELRLHYHADSDATRDIVFPNVPLRLADVQNQAQAPYAAWAALCSDPDPALPASPPCAYAEVPWNQSADLRNGAYDLTSAVTVTGSDSVTRTWTSSPFTVDREDLLITATTPVNPAPLLWDPNANSGSPAPLSLSASFHAAYKATGRATVQIYTSAQKLVRTLTKPVLTTDAGTSAVWDGNGDPVNGQPGPQQPRGVYLFRWAVSDSLGLSDSDKSPWLSVSQTESALTGDYNQTTDQNTTKDGCVLTDSATPKADASAANVQVYGGDSADMSALPGYVPMAQIVAPTPLSSLATNAPGASPPVWDEVTFPEVIQMEEVHLFCAQDRHAGTDRGGRSLWALQKNQAPKHSRADNYDMVQLSANPTADQAAVYWQKSLRDGTQTPHYVGGYAAFVKGRQNANTVLYDLQHDTLMGFYGQGAESPYYGGVSAKDTKIFSVPEPFYPASLGYKFLKDLPDGSLSKLRLAVWEGCFTALTASDPSNNFGNLVDGTVAKGARCAVGFTGFIYLADSDQNGVANYPYEIWAGNFWQALSQGQTSNGLPNGNPMNVSQAFVYANQQVIARCHQSEGYDTCRPAGDAATKIVPAQ